MCLTLDGLVPLIAPPPPLRQYQGIETLDRLDAASPPRQTFGIRPKDLAES